MPPTQADVQELIDAVRAGDESLVRRVLETGGELAAARDEQGVSVLLLARYHGHLPVVAALRERLDELDVFEAATLGEDGPLRAALDADPGAVRAVSADGFTALHLAAFFDQPAAASLLLERGADPGAVAANPSRVQPLHSAAAGRATAVSAALLGAGADPDARQQQGFTALHAAAQHGDTELGELLLRHGADPALKTDDGRDAAAFAREAGSAAFLALLAR